ncbi:MAG: serine/threonine protein kinase [Candidatus Anammoxibacter sp.]
MYKINNYEFNAFKLIAHMHHSNYAVLENAKGSGIKYCPHLSFDDEFFILRELDHKQIPKAHDYGRGMLYKDGKEVLNQYFIILDNMGRADFMAYYKGKVEKDFAANLKNIIKCFISTCDPLDCLHSLNYVHTDLKPGHLMLDPDSNTVSFVDFELTIKNSGLIKGFSKDYAAPEHEELLKLLKDAPPNVPLEAIANDIAIDQRADIYSLGTIMFEILTLKKWAEAKTAAREINNLIPQKLEKIIMAMVEKKPDNRISTVKELKRALQNIL